MTLAQFILNIRLQVPSAKLTGITPQQLTDLINQATDEVNILGRFYRKSSYFNAVADQQVYSMGTVVPNYLGMGKGILWWVDSNGKLKNLFPRTKKWLSKSVPNWRDTEAGGPQYYYAEGDELGVYPKPDTSLANGFYIEDYIAAATPMDNESHYPWTNTTVELKALRAADNAIVAYVRWKLNPALGKLDVNGITEKEYIREVMKARTQILRRPDIISDSSYRMRI